MSVRNTSKKIPPAKDEVTALGEALLDGLREAAAYERGERSLRTRIWQRDDQGWTLASDTVSALPGHAERIAPPPRYDSDHIRAIRGKLHMSQRLFASVLNVSDRTVQAWERGARRPDGSALRLLEIADEHPELLTATLATSTASTS